MSNENHPNKDHWKDLVESLDLDVEFDDNSLDTGDEPEVSELLQEETGQAEKASCDVAPSEELPIAETTEIPDGSAPSSKVDPLFDLGWNTPQEPKELAEKVVKEIPEAKLSEEPINEPAKRKLPKKSKKKPANRGFGFGLLSDEPEEEPAMLEEEPIKFEEEPAMSDQIEETPAFEEHVEESPQEPLEVSLDGGVQDDLEGASDWMALAAQLGVPIRSEGELEAKESSSNESVDAEEEPAESEQPEVEEEYDPLAAWGSPAEPAKPAERKSTREKRPPRRKAASVDSHEAADTEASEQDEPTMIGKSKEESDEPKKERGRSRGRGRGRGRGRERDVEAESVEVIEEEEVVSTSASLDVELFGDEEEESSEERPSKERRRRRPRRSRKPVATESEDREPTEEESAELDSDVYEDEEDETTSISHHDIPSWEEAIGLIVDKNLSARSSRSDESRGSRSRGGRGRSGRRGGRSRE